jgi:ABC-type phosphate transport system substrate-binding protein
LLRVTQPVVEPTKEDPTVRTRTLLTAVRTAPVPTTRLARIGLAGLGAVALTLAATLPAYADYAPGPGDIVGVGGDTPQFDLAFAADGDVAGASGYNASHNINRLVTFNATADGNARQAYANGSTLAAPIPLNPTITLRAGTSPVLRPQSSGAAINALVADTGAVEKINFVFRASVPTSAQQAAAPSAWGYLHTVQIGDDAVQIAASAGTHAPAGLTAAQLVGIYDGTYAHWNDIPGNSGGSSDAIIPLLPPTSSSITKTFLADLKTANSNTAPTLSGFKTVEQNDPTAITTATDPADAIVPFSSARLDLYTSGYFHDPTSNTTVDPGVSLLTGTPPQGGTAYNSPVDHYVVFRQSDTTSTTPMEPGGSLNWIQTLFSNPGGTEPFFERSTGQALIAAAGTTPDYADLGDAPSS